MNVTLAISEFARARCAGRAVIDGITIAIIKEHRP